MKSKNTEFDKLAGDMFELARWLQNRDSRWVLPPQAYCQFVIDILRANGYEKAAQVKVGPRPKKWEVK